MAKTLHPHHHPHTRVYRITRCAVRVSFWTVTGAAVAYGVPTVAGKFVAIAVTGALHGSALRDAVSR